jgi:hypothetical protein
MERNGACMIGDDQATLPTGRSDMPITPEEVARSFLRDGGTLDFDGEDEGRSIWRNSALRAVAAVVVISGAVAAYVIWLNPKAPAEHSPSGALSQTTVASSAASPAASITKPSQPSSNTTTTLPLLANNAVMVEVLNASTTSQLASHTATGLEQSGFGVGVISDAPSVIAGGGPSEIFYGPGGLPAAQTLALALSGSVILLPDASLAGNDVTLWVAGPQLTVKTATATP